MLLNPATAAKNISKNKTVKEAMAKAKAATGINCNYEGNWVMKYPTHNEMLISKAEADDLTKEIMDYYQKKVQAVSVTRQIYDRLKQH